MSDYIKNINEKLNTYFESKNLSSYKISKLTGLSEPTIGRYRKGESNPTEKNLKILLDTFEGLCDYLDYSFDIINESQPEYKTNVKSPPECQECLSLKKELAHRDKRIEDLEEMVRILKQANADLRMQATYQDNTQKKNAS